MEANTWDLGLGFGPLRRAREMGSDVQSDSYPAQADFRPAPRGALQASVKSRQVAARSSEQETLTREPQPAPRSSADPVKSRVETTHASAGVVMKRGPCPIRAICAVLQDLLQMKYGKVLDAADFVAKVTGFSGDSNDMDPGQVIAALGAKEDLQFRAGGGELLDVKIQYRQVKRFDELRREIRRMPGTSCAVTVVRAEYSNQVETIATFREGYADSGTLVGKSSPGPPLIRFTAREFRSAIVLDPVILRIHPPGGKGTAKTTPPTSDEYCRIIRGRTPTAQAVKPKAAVGMVKCTGVKEPDPSRPAEDVQGKQLPVPSESSEPRQASTMPGMVPAAAFSDEASDSAQSSLQRTEKQEPSIQRSDKQEPSLLSFPSEEGMQGIRDLLDRPYAKDDEALKALRTLYAWLKPGQPNSHRARGMFAAVGLHGQIVGVMRSLACDAIIAHQSFLVVLQASLGHAGNAESLARSGAVAEICSAMDLHRQNLDVQRDGVQALDCLACYDSVAQLSVASGAPSRVLRAMNGHLSCAQLQFFGCKALQRLILRGGSPTAGIAAAAEAAKAAHPNDDGVRMYSSALIKCVTPDAMWATSDLKTSYDSI